MRLNFDVKSKASIDVTFADFSCILDSPDFLNRRRAFRLERRDFKLIP